MVGSLAVYLPDLTQVISLLLTVWMFLTPIFYPDDVVPAQFSVIFRLNPMARLIRLYRDCFLSGYVPTLQGILITGLICVAVLSAGYFWFMHTKKGFADVL
jgi:lipopolysaccharide transport system permease protein